jgi:chromosome segregation ATPase
MNTVVELTDKAVRLALMDSQFQQERDTLARIRRRERCLIVSLEEVKTEKRELEEELETLLKTLDAIGQSLRRLGSLDATVRDVAEMRLKISITQDRIQRLDRERRSAERDVADIGARAADVTREMERLSSVIREMSLGQTTVGY